MFVFKMCVELPSSGVNLGSGYTLGVTWQWMNYVSSCKIVESQSEDNYNK